MTTEHFNQLTESEAERLAILIEECAEVAQSACKILRHGYESCNPKKTEAETNRQALTRECGDLIHSITRMTSEKDLDAEEIGKKAASKPAHINQQNDTFQANA